MARFAYVNGRFVHHAHAMIHVEDRGYQFADGVYEVITLIEGGFIDEDGHLARLRRSLGELRIAPPLAEGPLRLVMRELVRRNGVRNGLLYLQATRGVAPRDFKFPTAPKSALVMTTRRSGPALAAAEAKPVAVVTAPDQRWARRDIKTTGLLAQVLAKQKAAESGAFETWMVDGDGFVTEGASSNAWIVTRDGTLVTRQADPSILSGVTGNSIENLAQELGIRIERRAFTVAEALNAKEAFLTSATTFCLPIGLIDGRPIGNGDPDGITAQLRRAYLDYARRRQDRTFPWSQSSIASAAG
jgi:D-alanine transaminase